MAKTCMVTGKRIATGNNVSHANNKTKRTFKPNIFERRIYAPSLGRHVKLTVSARGLKTIEKRGIDAVVRDLVKQGYRL